MKHISEIEIIEYAAGRLDEPRRRQIAEHLEVCEACSVQYSHAAAVWEGLGLWEVDASGRDVAGKSVELAAKREEGAKIRRELRMRFASVALRAAASIIIAVGLGHKLGEYSVAETAPGRAPSSEKPEYLAALGLEWASDLAWLVLEEEPVGEEEQG